MNGRDPTSSEEREAERKHQIDLLLAISRGDDEALSELYDLFERPLFSLGMRWLSDRGLAEELVQEVTLRIWKGAPTFDPRRGHASSWIFGVARNTANDLLRSSRRTPTPVDVPSELNTNTFDEDAAWLAWTVAEALGTLPREQREVVELAFVNQCTHSEVARSLDIPLGTVKTRMYLGLKKLRAKLLDLGVLEGTKK